MRIRPTGLPASAKASARAGDVLGVDAAVGAFDGKVGTGVLGRTEAAGHDQCVELLGLGVRRISLTSPRAMRADSTSTLRVSGISSPVRWLITCVCAMFGAKHCTLGAALVEAQQGDHAFMDFGAVVNATAGKDHRTFFLLVMLITPSQDGAKCPLLWQMSPSGFSAGDGLILVDQAWKVAPMDLILYGGAVLLSC